MERVYMRKVFFILMTAVLLGSTAFASCTSKDDDAASQHEQDSVRAAWPWWSC